LFTDCAKPSCIFHSWIQNLRHATRNLHPACDIKTAEMLSISLFW
jgi:hypothetical protein